MTHRHAIAVAVHVLLVRGRDVLLLLRSNTGYEDGRYSVPAGHVERGEEIVEAAIREAREEAAVEITASDLRVAGVMHRRADDERIDFFVTARTWAGEPRNAEPHKCAELRWCAIDALPENTIPYVRRAIEHGVEGMWFDTFGWEVEAENSIRATQSRAHP